MKCKVEKSTISGLITCPPNKSYSHRAVFMAALAGKGSKIDNLLLSEDTKATIRACESFGARFSYKENGIEVIKQIGEEKIHDIVDAGNSGTTIRIAIALASTFSKKITLTGDESLKKRPMQPLLDSLEELGAKCNSNEGRPPVQIKGRIKGGKTSIPGDVSSQFISALLICAPLTEKGITLTIQKETVSKPYLDATIATMKKFGITTKVIEPYKEYHVQPQKCVPTRFVVPSDFSSLALLLAAAVLVGDSNLKVNVKQDDLPQGDKKFIEILHELGINVSMNGEKVSVGPNTTLRGGKFDLSNNPDLLPPLSILSLKATSPIEIFNVKHARIKETDRISLLAKELSKIGLNISEKEDGMIITNTGENHGGVEFDPVRDHRLFMAFCIVGMYLGNCTIKDADSVSISYPNFVSDMKKIGADISNE